MIETARTIGGVKQVVSYVKLAGEPLNLDQANTGNAVVSQSQKPQALYNTNINANTSGGNAANTMPVVTDDVDVPARTVNEPSIEDQYYN